MRDERFDDRFETDLRAALRHELATARVGVAAPQVRGRIAARDRSRRTARLLLLAAAAVLAVAVAIPVLSGLLFTGPVAPRPGGVEPATVATIDASSGDLVLAQAWPDGRVEESARYPGALDLLRRAMGDASASRLPDAAVATVGPGRRLAVGLPGGDVLVFPEPGKAGSAFVSSADEAQGSATWLGWTDDGRLAIVDDRLLVRLIEPASRRETTAALPRQVLPDWTRGQVQRLTWTEDGQVVAVRSDPASFQSAVGLLDIAADPPTFSPGLPASVRAATGLEPRRATDGSAPGTGCQDERPVSACAGLLPGSSAGSEAADTWFVAMPNDAVTDVVRAADGGGILVVVRGTDADRGRLVVASAPGTWRDAITFAAPAYSPQSSGLAYVAGVAPGGRSVTLWVEDALLVGDLATGAATTLPAGTLLVGWPAAPVIATETLTSITPCEPPTDGAVAAITLSNAATSPSSAGAVPVVGARDDADPWRADEMAGSDPLVVDPGGRLVLALPAGVCAEAAMVEALAPAGLPYAVPGELGSWAAGTGTQAGLVPVAAPESGGEWIVRAKLWLTGADREAILLYRVRTTGPAKPVVAPEPVQP